MVVRVGAEPGHRQDRHLGRPGPGVDRCGVGRQDDLRRHPDRAGQRPGRDTYSFYKPTRPGSYPIVLATYEIVCSKYPDPKVGAAVKAFLQSTIGDGQHGLAGNGYIPVPASFKSRLAESINAIS